VFEWDEAKREAKLVKHGVDLVDAQVLFVAYTVRGEARRLISARRASSNERRAYNASSGRAGR
jgi:uncharacterized DUF497 family protein